MAEKSKMACNNPMKSHRKSKKKMVKTCQGDQEQLTHGGETV